MAKDPCPSVQVAKTTKTVHHCIFAILRYEKVKRGDLGTPNLNYMTLCVEVYRFLVENQCPGIAYNYEQKPRS